ncbi:unnamed protein product [Hapterophycus canaliculatus]
MRPAALLADLSLLALGTLCRETCAFAIPASLPQFIRARPAAASGNFCLQMGATSALIETTACQVLRLVLRNGRAAQVSCSVKSNGFELLQGKLRGASVSGQDWASRLDLTARSINVDVGSVAVDAAALLRHRVLRFLPPSPSGNAIVVFNAQDFGNFLVHPLIHGMDLAGRSFVFDREGVVVDPINRTVGFRGRWGEQKLCIELSQTTARERLVARVVHGVDGEAEGLEDAAADHVASEVSDFFNNLEVDLDGPVLSFSSMSLEGRGIESGRLKLRLGIVVRKLPSIRAIASF